ncbi:MAG: hypothetical protein JWL95_2998 [Gemmatimonadetes bacterium]|nr:hypothetical protein [Gemmatimonadota bacterium]
MRRRLSLDSRPRGRGADGRADDEADRSADPGLRALFIRAQELVAALRAGADEAVLVGRVRSYMRCAAAEGISDARIRAALVYLVREHGRSDERGRAKSADLTTRDAARTRILALVERLVTAAQSAHEEHRDAREA